MKQFTPPSKEEIKERYGIANDDFEILVSESPPPAKKLQDDATMLESVASLFGVPTFLLKTVAGVLLAIIFLPYWGPKVREEFRDCMVTTYSYYSDVLSKEHVPLETPGFRQDTPRYVITVPDHRGIIRDVVDPKSGRFPEGSGIFPYLG